MKKTLFHSLTFPPDTISTGMIVSEIATGFNSKFQNVEVLASSPQYNIKSFEEFKKNNTNYKNIKVHYIESNKRKFTNSARFFQWLIFNLNSIKFIYKHRKEYENIFIFSYPPTMNLVCIFTSKILKINTIYSLWELYPEIAEKLKEQPNFVLNKLFKLIDNFCLKSVNKIVVNSDLLKDYLVNNRNIVRNKVEVIYHFSPYKKSDYASNLSLKKIFYAGLAVGAKRNGGQETTLIFQMTDFLNMGAKVVGNGHDTTDRKSTRLNSSHSQQSRMPSSA